MTEIQSHINAGLVFDNILFETYRDRCLYIRAEGHRKRWLEQNPGKWRRLEDVLLQAEMPVTPRSGPPLANGSISATDGEGSADMTETQVLGANDCQTKPVTAAAASPSQTAKGQIEIGGRPYVSGARLASLLGISERTLSRRCANGSAPPHVKLAGVYYDLERVRELAVGKN